MNLSQSQIGLGEARVPASNNQTLPLCEALHAVKDYQDNSSDISLYEACWRVAHATEKSDPLLSKATDLVMFSGLLKNIDNSNAFHSSALLIDLVQRSDEVRSGKSYSQLADDMLNYSQIGDAHVCSLAAFKFARLSRDEDLINIAFDNLYELGKGLKNETHIANLKFLVESAKCLGMQGRYLTLKKDLIMGY